MDNPEEIEFDFPDNKSFYEQFTGYAVFRVKIHSDTPTFDSVEIFTKAGRIYENNSFESMIVSCLKYEQSGQNLISFKPKPPKLRLFPDNDDDDDSDDEMELSESEEVQYIITSVASSLLYESIFYKFLNKIYFKDRPINFPFRIFYGLFTTYHLKPPMEVGKGIELVDVDGVAMHLEWVTTTSLAGYRKSKQNIDKTNQLKILKSIATAIKILNDNGFCHSNIDIGDIYLKQNGQGDVEHVVLGNFKDVVKFKNNEINENVKLETKPSKGSIYVLKAYSPPELYLELGRQDFDPNKIDVWILGAAFYFMNGLDLYPSNNTSSLFSFSTNAKLLKTDNFSIEFINFIKNCFAFDPKNRYDVERAYNEINKFQF